MVAFPLRLLLIALAPGACCQSADETDGLCGETITHSRPGAGLLNTRRTTSYAVQVGARVPYEAIRNSSGIPSIVARAASLVEIDPLEWSDKVRNATTQDVQFVWDTFFPGMEYPGNALLNALVSVLIAVFWLWLYFQYIYEDDRLKGLDRWGKERLAAISEHAAATKTMDVDMILLCHHPRADRDDAEASVSADVMEQILLGVHDTPGWRSASLSLGRSASLGLSPLARSTSPQREVSEDAQTKAAARRALLHYINERLPNAGFDVEVFAATGGSELFLGVSLRNQSAIEQYLQLNNIPLQIQKEMIAKLGISQPSEHICSDPPYIRYDPRIAEYLCTAGKSTNSSVHDVYRTYRTAGVATGGARVSLVNRTDRIRIIHNELINCIDIDAAKREGLLIDMLPNHDYERLLVLRAAWLAEILDYSVVQPIHPVRGYFGSRVAFSFAWRGLYTKGLLALTPLAVMYMLYHSVFDVAQTSQQEGTKQLLGSSIVLIFWSQVMFNLWDREQAFFIKLWDIDSEDHVRLARPQFRGTLGPSLIDANMKELHYSATLAWLWHLASWSVTAFCCLLVALFIWLDESFVEGSGSLTASVTVAGQIQVFEILYELVAERLTNMENHRLEFSHYRSFLWKQFVFQSVNSYWPFLYYIFLQARRTEHVNLSLLQQKLSTTLVLVTVCQILKPGAAFALVKGQQWYKTWQLQRRLGRVLTEEETMSFSERQSSYVEFTMTRQSWAMLAPVLSLGHTLLFGAAIPILIPLCACVFMVHLRTSVILLTRFAKRPLPIDTVGICAWRNIIRLLMNASVLSTGFLLVVYGESFRGARTSTKTLGIILFSLVASCCKGIVNVLVPRTDAPVQLLASRRNHVERAVWRVGTEATHENTAIEGCESSMIRKEVWSDIPTFM